ncbi:MAG TPA: maleylpyruvate isomerase family mycothiol-dependent enzyme [Intrasporangium sp.]|uniref:maleylpyruvate isomerase family mycothiol-dependent enzyme n=1 Tax=Intrasporangium sp. TaxID=1925024 RepID=UPI002D766C80|nr:maleylpyruvate isomerase family mycothiol-dependent enzyme [Intrasporangium sp.]HET7399447.1 maleylpyruvate isomerase family mycothiol-dependent enzyme [Intrasporangium sp.]
MEADRCVDVLEAEAAAFADIIRSADPATPVPGCPGWTLADLAAHLGGVHRWARHAVLVGRGEEPVAPDDPEERHRWFVEGAGELVQTLRSVDPARPCWTFAPPGQAGFWMRRQAHETTLHRWDAAMSTGAEAGIAEDVALDGIDEVVTMFVPRQVRLGRLAPFPSVVHLVADGHRIPLSGGVPHLGVEPVGMVEGAAEALLLLLWRRIAPDDPRVVITGDETAVRTLCTQALTP